MNIIVLFTIASAYKILNNVIPTFPKVINTCQNIDYRLFKTTLDVSNEITKCGFPVILNQNNYTTLICNKLGSHYGNTMTNNTKFTSIIISNELFKYPKTLYNTLLHEMLHSIGLDHNNGEPGMMSYSIKIGSIKIGSIKIDSAKKDSIIEDNVKLWLSIDDIYGLAYIKNNKVIPHQ